jgi:hypothetical protein
MKKTESSEKDELAKQKSMSIMQAPVPIHVEAENFHLLVQSPTAGKRKRKAVRIAEVDIGEAKVAQKSAQPSKEKQEQSLLGFLDLLDRECAPPSKVSANRGFFATAGLVKGVDMEEGLPPPDSPDSPLPEEPQSIRSFGKILTPLNVVPCSSPLVGCTECDEGPGCLSPRSYQIMEHAQRAAKYAVKARQNAPGSGPVSLSLEKIGDYERLTAPGEWGYPVHGASFDLLYYKGELIITDQLQEGN